MDVEADLLSAALEERVDLDLGSVAVSSISLFELQAKASRQSIPPTAVLAAVEAVVSAFRVEPFYAPAVVKASLEVHQMIKDYIDCLIVATAIATKEALVTEDSRILAERRAIRERFGVEVLSYRDLRTKSG